MTTSTQAAVSTPSAVQLTGFDLFCAFSHIALSGFGGVLPFAYRGLVEKRHWLTAAEFGEYLGMSQMLPGPTICNVAMMVGHRFAGTRGAFCALTGMIVFPFLLVIALGILYQQYGELAVVRNGLRGMGAVAAGLILGTALKMAMTMLREKIEIKSRTLQATLAVLAFAGIVIMKWKLIWVFVSLALVGGVLFYLMEANNER